MTPDGEQMGLSADEEDAFAAIASQFGPGGSSLIPWGPVAVSVAGVGVAVISAALLGLPGPVVVAFGLTFVVALTAGLLVIARSDGTGRQKSR